MEVVYWADMCEEGNLTKVPGSYQFSLVVRRDLPL